MSIITSILVLVVKVEQVIGPLHFNNKSLGCEICDLVSGTLSCNLLMDMDINTEFFLSLAMKAKNSTVQLEQDRIFLIQELNRSSSSYFLAEKKVA